MVRRPWVGGSSRARSGLAARQLFESAAPGFRNVPARLPDLALPALGTVCLTRAPYDAGAKSGIHASKPRQIPASTIGAACLLLLTVMFWTSGALWPTELPEYASSSRQITGMVLMLILLPSYLLAAIFTAQRRSLSI